MDVEFNYHGDRELYDQAFEAADYEEFLKIYEPEGPYSDPLELLAEEEGEEAAKQVIEIAETQRILNGNSGSLAGMDFVRPEASD